MFDGIANGYEILMKDEESDGKIGGETGEPQGNKTRQRFWFQKNSDIKR